METGSWKKADLHIHTCLSPCGDWGMTPVKIIKAAQSEKLDIIAVCDHNSAENAGAVVRAARQTGVAVVAGMEICTREEVHLLALFKFPADARKMGDMIHRGLSEKNYPDLFGYQVIADENDMVSGQEEKLLISASQLSLDEAVRNIHSRDGIAIAAHVDRPVYSIISQLGFIPDHLPLDGIEISRHALGKTWIHKFLDNTGLPCILSSDAHFLQDIATGYTVFDMRDTSFESMRNALSNKKFRRFVKRMES
ncbi:MAG: PHP domain-containing protein [Desulfarculaceae bacterium]|nr:PHP domain-containing protein [Desulfarculaceae bacterium]